MPQKTQPASSEETCSTEASNCTLTNPPQPRGRTIHADDLADPHPLYCIWEITLRCDLGCRHCGSRAGKPREGELDTAQALRVVDQLASLGVREVVLIGGEAYLREDWDQIAAALVKRGLRCGMTTGARGLTQERLDRAVAAGIDKIAVSIDGLQATHDAQRGVQGSWAAAVDAAKRIGRSPVKLGINTQINQLTMPELPAMADLLVDLGAKGWQIQLTVPMGQAADRPALLLQPYQLLELFPLLERLKRERLVPNGIRLFPANNIGYFGAWERHIRSGGERGVHWSSCPAGQWALGIEADGTVKGCPSLPTAAYAGGNILDTELAAIVADAPELRVLRERTVEDLWGFCKTCYYASVCKAGCSWMAHTLFGRPGNNPYCIHRANTLHEQGLRERVVHKESAPGLPFDHGLFDLVVEPIHTTAAPSLRALVQGGNSAVRSWTKAELDAALKVG